MPVDNRSELYEIVNRCRLTLTHFACGTFPEARGIPDALTVNRFFMPLANPHGAACFIADDRRKVTLRPGLSIFIPAYHTARVRLDRRLRFLSVQFRLEAVEHIDLFAHAKRILVFDDASLSERGMAAFALENKFQAAAQIAALTLDFCGRVLREIPSDTIARAVEISEFQAEFDFLRRNLSAALTVEELAVRRGVSRETFSRRFAAVCGMPPKVFLSRMLLDRAAELLLRSDKRIGEIAGELGFTSEYYFSRFFRKHIGVPPLAFRRRQF